MTSGEEMDISDHGGSRESLQNSFNNLVALLLVCIITYLLKNKK
ncbi:hypothetical protein ACQW5G_04215 [Fructilactobacillus sp. Tb1]